MIGGAGQIDIAAVRGALKKSGIDKNAKSPAFHKAGLRQMY
jgi:hypothetical protein